MRNMVFTSFPAQQSISETSNILTRVTS